MKDIKRISYEKYQIHWMLSHDITMTDIGEEAEKWHLERQEDSSENGTFRDFLEERGFGGCLWACYAEFMENEYQDRMYMHFLLTEKEWENYLVDIGDGYVTYIEAWNLIETCVKNGILQKTDSHIFIERETGWYLEPKDMVIKDLMYDKEGRDALTEALKADETEVHTDDI